MKKYNKEDDTLRDSAKYEYLEDIALDQKIELEIQRLKNWQTQSK